MSDHAPTMRGYRRLSRDTMLFGAAGALGKALALVTVPILSRALGPENYGDADLAVSFAALATLIVTFAGDMSAARLRGLAADHRENAGILTSWIAASLVVSTGFALVAWPFASFIAETVWDAPDRVDLARLAILLIPVAAMQAATTDVLRLVGRPVAAAAAAIVDLVAQVTLAVTFVLIGWGPIGVLSGFIGGSAIGLACAAILATPHLRARPEWALGARVVTTGMTFLPVGTTFIGAEYVVRFLLVDGVGIHAVGQFAVAIRLASALLLVSAAFSLAWGPYGLSLHPTAANFRMFAGVLRAVGGLLLCAAVVMGAVAPETIALISGGAYLPAASALPGLAWGAAGSGIFFVIVVGAGVQGRHRHISSAAFAGALIQIILTAITVTELGLAGVGLSAMAGRLFSITLLGLRTRDLIQMSPESLVMVTGSCVATIALTALNAQPADTTSVRLGIAAFATAAAAAWAIKRGRGRGPIADVNPTPGQDSR